MEDCDDNDRDCITTLSLGLNQNTPRRYLDDPHVFLDLSPSCRRYTSLEIVESSSSLKSKENEKGEEEIDFFRDSGRKKLRLTKDQTTLLEDSFKQHSTLNTAQKQALAGKLCLKPRQVEVWFQNRRARLKLKQTEVEWQFLKKNCERLSEENHRLKKELVELRSNMKISNSPPAMLWQAQQQRSFNVSEVVKLEKCSHARKID